MTQKIVNCMVCDRPWVDMEEPFICPVCHLTGRAAKELAETRAAAASLKGKNEALKRRVKELEKS